MKYISYLGIAPVLSLALASAWHYLWFFFGWPGVVPFLHQYVSVDGESSFDLSFVEMLIVVTVFVYLCTYLVTRRHLARPEG